MKLRFQFGLKWFLLATTLIAVLAGTVGKRLYDRWQSQIELAAQEKARLRLLELGVEIRQPNKANIGAIHFPQKRFVPADFQLLARLPPFASIDVSFTGFADADLPALARCPDLKVLWVGGNVGITDRGVKDLGRFTELEELDLGKTGITDESLKYISKCDHLQRLWLVFTNITSKGLSGLGAPRALQMLDLSHTEVDDEAFPAIAQIEALEILRLDHTKVRGHGISALARLPSLKGLRLNNCELGDGSGFEALHQVESLSLDDSKIATGFLQHVSKMRGLRSLSLMGSGITDEQLAELAEATQLNRLALHRTLITGDGLTYLENLKQLEALYLRQTKVTPAAANALAAKLPTTHIMTDHGDYNSKRPGRKPRR